MVFLRIPAFDCSIHNIEQPDVDDCRVNIHKKRRVAWKTTRAREEGSEKIISNSLPITKSLLIADVEHFRSHFNMAHIQKIIHFTTFIYSLLSPLLPPSEFCSFSVCAWMEYVPKLRLVADEW